VINDKGSGTYSLHQIFKYPNKEGGTITVS